MKLLDDTRVLSDDLDEFAPDQLLDNDEDLERDLLGEMEIAARIMITGGDEREDARLTRPDRLIIRKAILRAAATVKDAGRESVLDLGCRRRISAAGAGYRTAGAAPSARPGNGRQPGVILHRAGRAVF